jgi:hypothetical protein
MFYKKVGVNFRLALIFYSNINGRKADSILVRARPFLLELKPALYTFT